MMNWSSLMTPAMAQRMKSVSAAIGDPAADAAEARIMAATESLRDDVSMLEPAPCAAPPHPAEPTTPAAPPPLQFGAERVILPKLGEGPVILRRPSSRGTDDFDVHLYGIIQPSVEYHQSVANLVHVLEYAHPDAEITIYLATPGGSLTTATRIMAAMRRSRAHVTTVVAGWCCSAGALIWAQGTDRLVNEAGYLMVHMSSHSDFGHSATVAASAGQIVDYVTRVTLQPLVDCQAMTAAELDDVVERRMDVYLDAQTLWDRIPGSKT